MRRKISLLYYIGLVLCFIFIFQCFPSNHLNNQRELEIQLNPFLSSPDQWLQNNDFSSQQNWFYTMGDQGDNSSVDADISGGRGNFRVLGEKRTFNLYGIPNSTDSPNWKEFEKPDYYKPDNTGIDSYGCWVSHEWAEKSNQFPGVHWRKNVSVPVDMSKYTITSASIEVSFNASVSNNLEVLGEGSWYGIGDFVIFYVQISDMEYKNPYYIAFNKTRNLGLNSGPTTINDKLIEAYDENVIITALTSAFAKDIDHNNFTITLGIDIYSEDNVVSDTDTYTSLRIKNCNLSFSYERNIERFTSISWNQIGNRVSGENVRITNALCYFNYSISEVWPYDLSPFSEMRTLINDNPYKETIQLSTMTTSLQHIRFEGEDFKSLFREGVNITIGVEIYLANTFRLNRTISVSIDDIYLFISYIFIAPGVDLSFLVIGLTAGIIGIFIAFSLYQFHFKYPPLVRKIRKLKKRVKRGKAKKLILVNKREDIIHDSLNEKKNIIVLNIKQFKDLQKQ
ncbi:MAG: hypothetical protein JSV62_04680 [Promethearchaeota archaeon]|nr:MAG: hypothetical protein JSV62_04680 [Candidatus Lokiarchaeota archaeon]